MIQEIVRVNYVVKILFNMVERDYHVLAYQVFSVCQKKPQMKMIATVRVF